MSEPDLAILITAANRGLSDRLVAAVAAAGGEAMRPSFGFVLRAVAATAARLSSPPSARARRGTTEPCSR